MDGLKRVLSSYRAWAAIVAIVVTLAVYLGLREDVADKIAQNVLIIIGILIGAETARRH